MNQRQRVSCPFKDAPPCEGLIFLNNRSDHLWISRKGPMATDRSPKKKSVFFLGCHSCNSGLATLQGVGRSRKSR